MKISQNQSINYETDKKWFWVWALLLIGILAVAIVVGPAYPASSNWGTKPPPPEVVAKGIKTLEVLWEGATDIEMLHQVRSDLARAKEGDYKVLRVTLISGGGPVITSLEIARLVRDASDNGLIVEFHAVGLCASGCTFVLSSGTSGSRFISKYALVLVHAPQTSGGFMEAPICATYRDAPKSVNEKTVNVILSVMRDLYVRFTGKSPKEVEDWLSCGYEQVGTGELAVSLGMADKTE